MSPGNSRQLRPYDLNDMIVTKNLTKHFDKGLIKALNGVSLHIRAGELVSLMGPSGSGKSTLLQLIGAIDKPSSGQVVVNGTALDDWRFLHVFRAQFIGFIFQFHHLLPHLSARENVEAPMVKASKDEKRARSIALLKALDLGHRLTAPPNSLSGGERQRVAIARSLANDPRIILADEPTGSIDTKTGSMVIDFLLQDCRDNGRTLILATHNPKLARRCDRTLHLLDGCLQCSNHPETGSGKDFHFLHDPD